MRSSLVVVVCALAMCSMVNAVQLGSMFTNNIVLQQGKPSCFWGTAAPNAKIALEYLAVHEETTADQFGNFQVCGASATPKEGAFSVSVSSANEASAVLENVVYGDIYFCSGQSNMQFTLSMAFGGKEAIAGANDPQLRLFSVKRVLADTPQWDVTDSNGLGWAPATPTSTGGQDWTYFSAACYFFGAQIRKNHPDTPIGLIDSNWGGTYIQTWMSPEALKECPETLMNHLKTTTKLLNSNLNAPAEWMLQDENPNRPSVCYNQMVFPFLRMPMRGVLWYQGESNAGDEQYGCRFKAMINDWRKKWNIELPFLFVQIAPYVSEDLYSYAFLRQRQEDALQLPGVGMAVTVDLGDKSSPYNSIHPRDKASVAYRLSLAAESIIYGNKDVHYTGPKVSSVSSLAQSPSGWSVTITFDPSSVSGKLTQSGTAQCTNCCNDLPFVFNVDQVTNLRATQVDINDNEVTVSLTNPPATAKVVAIMLAFETYPECALVDDASKLPASPFLLPVTVPSK